MVLEESGSPIASPALLDEYKNLVEALEDSAQWSASTKGMHKDPLTFSYSVVTAQMRAQLRQGGSRLTPQHMRANLIHVVRRMQTVADVNPYKNAIMGAELMPAVVDSLVAKLHLESQG